METLLKNLANRLAAYGATYKYTSYSSYGYVVLGDVQIEVEVNIRKVAKIEGKRFLYGSRRGYDLGEMVRHILLSLPRLQERAKQAKEHQAKRMTIAESIKACRDLTDLVNDDRIRVRFDEYQDESRQFCLTFQAESHNTMAIVADMIREVEDFSRPAKLLQRSTSEGPMTFSFADENGPTGDSISLKGLANMGVDLDQAVKLIVGETMTHEDFLLIRTN